MPYRGSFCPTDPPMHISSRTMHSTLKCMLLIYCTHTVKIEISSDRSTNLPVYICTNLPHHAQHNTEAEAYKCTLKCMLLIYYTHINSEKSNQQHSSEWSQYQSTSEHPCVHMHQPLLTMHNTIHISSRSIYTQMYFYVTNIHIIHLHTH
jgi:hypothetical protein